MAAVEVASSSAEGVSAEVGAVEEKTSEQTVQEVAAKRFNQALATVNQEREYEVVCMGQPHARTNGEDCKLQMDPSIPLDLGMVIQNETVMIGAMQLTSLGYDPTVGRTFGPVLSVEDLTAEIIRQVKQYLAAKENPEVWVTVQGVKYHLETCEGLHIEPSGRVSLDHHPIVQERGGVMDYFSASSLRSSGILTFQKEGERIFLSDEQDGEARVPRFYIDISQKVAGPNGEECYLFGREEGKI